jgi:peroxiredoxin
LDFGAIPASQQSLLRDARAPEIALHDRSGKLVRLSELRGKKVLIVTWASWCRCRDDLPDWQALYAELHPQGLELLSVAQETGGDADTGPYFDKASPTFTSIVDRKHVVTAAFHLDR